MTDDRRPPTVVAVALGSNLTDRGAHLDYAVSQLAKILEAPRVSRSIETAPVGIEQQPRFLNAVMVGRYPGTPRALLDTLMQIERERGRERLVPGGARTLDLDLILFGDRVLDEPDLKVPHPRFRERGFVLQPLAEIAPELVDPVTGLTVGELWRKVKGQKSKVKGKGPSCDRP